MANEAIKPNLQKQSGDNVIGFPDLISQNKENVTFSPLSMENGFQSIKSQAGASAGKPPQTPQGNVTALFGELQAASELSLDELAKQSELLKDIEQNTKSKQNIKNIGGGKLRWMRARSSHALQKSDNAQAEMTMPKPN